jgi:hypothetical protein
MTRHDAPLKRRAAARARSKCEGSAWPGGRALRLQRRAAPTRTAHAAVARKRSPARLCMMMSEAPSPPSHSAGARSALCTEPLDRRKAHDVFDNDIHQEATRALSGGNTCRRPGAQRLRHRRRARSARGVDGSQRLRRPGRPGTGAQRPRRAAPCADPTSDSRVVPTAAGGAHLAYSP